MRKRRGRERKERGEVRGERKAREERERRKVGEKGEGGIFPLLLGGYILATSYSTLTHQPVSRAMFLNLPDAASL